MEKLCPICGETKPASEFYVSKGRLYTYCKPCQIAKARRTKMLLPKRFHAPEGMKRCRKCRSIKPIAEFYVSSEHYDGRSDLCAVCSRAQYKTLRDKDLPHHRARQRRWCANNPDRVRDAGLKQNYGMPYGTYDRMLTEQNGVCAICGTAETGRRRYLHVDHCHATGIIRGLLCGRCNTGIGQLRHDVALLQSAISYLVKYSPTM